MDGMCALCFEENKHAPWCPKNFPESATCACCTRPGTYREDIDETMCNYHYSEIKKGGRG